MADILEMKEETGIDYMPEEEAGIPVEEVKPKRMPFMIWKVNGEEYRMKLTASMICTLENKYKKNLLMLIDSMPPLSTMLTIVQAAMQKHHHGMTYSRVQAIYDDYVEEGGNQTDFFTDVIVELLSVSGFFTDKQTEEVTAKKDVML